MFEDAKSKYLFAFEAAFDKLCGGPRVGHRWQEGMFISAHMYFGLGISYTDGAQRYFDAIMRYASNRKTLAELREKHRAS